MHELLLRNQDALDPGDLERYADEVGLDVERFTQEVRRREHAPRIAKVVDGAEASRVTGTPTFFANGRRHDGPYDAGTLEEVVREALAGAAAKAR